MDKESIYSLWLMPSGKTGSELANLILNLSKTHSTVSFEPHLTLFWPIIGTEKEVISKTQALASFLVPFSVDLKKPEWMNDYFRCIFLSAEKSDLLVGSHNKAKEIFAQKSPNHAEVIKQVYGEKLLKEILAREKEPNFLPHLSIMYGLLPENIKTSIIRTLPVQKISFQVNSLYLYETLAEPKKWRLVKEFRLS